MSEEISMDSENEEVKELSEYFSKFQSLIKEANEMEVRKWFRMEGVDCNLRDSHSSDCIYV